MINFHQVIGDESAEIKAEQINQRVLIDSVRPKPGHKLFKFHKGILAEVGPWEYEVSHVEFGVQGEEVRRVRKLIVQPETSYLSCLNKKNAIKKLNRNGYKVDGFLTYSYADRN